MLQALAENGHSPMKRKQVNFKDNVDNDDGDHGDVSNDKDVDDDEGVDDAS